MLLTKPRTVIIGVWFLYIPVIISFLIGVIEAFTPSSVDSLQANLAPYGPTTQIIIAVTTLLIIWFVINRISAGKSWARGLFLIGNIIGSSLWLISINFVIENGWLAVTSGTISIVFNIIGLIYLFIPPSRPWFRKNREFS